MSIPYSLDVFINFHFQSNVREFYSKERGEKTNNISTFVKESNLNDFLVFCYPSWLWHSTSPHLFFGVYYSTFVCWIMTNTSRLPSQFANTPTYCFENIFFLTLIFYKENFTVGDVVSLPPIGWNIHLLLDHDLTVENSEWIPN